MTVQKFSTDEKIGFEKIEGKVSRSDERNIYRRKCEFS